MRDFSPKSGLSARLQHWTGKAILRLAGWNVEGAPPDVPKSLLLVAPHTSNWDLVIMLAIGFYFNLRVYWMAKQSIFRWPFRGFMMWLGGIPIDRSARHNVVDQAVAAFNSHETLMLAILPEGTRKRADFWKSGFYHMALGAKVPMALGFADYKRKIGGFGPTVMPTGDVEADMAKLREFYKDIVGKKPQNQGPIRLRPPEPQERP